MPADHARPRGHQDRRVPRPHCWAPFPARRRSRLPRPGVEDTRTLGQRNADAMDTIAGVILTEAKHTPDLEAPTLVTITMSETTFLDAKNHLENATHTRTGAKQSQGAEQGAAPFPTIRIADGPLVPPADLGRLICGSKVGRMVIGARGEPLNVGRAQRLFTGARRHAVETRDQHCAWPECTTPARYAEVHHLDWWDEDHGETDTKRGVLVCSYHHHELHRHDLDLVKTPPDTSSEDPVLLGDTDGDPPMRPPNPPKPGDPDYEPPRYELVPRARTAAERRTRLAHRLREGTRTRRSA
ncbi:MAG: HNH endonuclease [Actinomycetales bacterium]|nr:HNH endonuclease [Actinomycetales bacterium]